MIRRESAMTTYTIAPTIAFMLSGLDIHADVWNMGTWDGKQWNDSRQRQEHEPIGSGYDALVLAMRRGVDTKRGLRVELDDTARKELVSFLEAQYIGARDSEEYGDMAAIRRCFKRLGVQVWL